MKTATKRKCWKTVTVLGSLIVLFPNGQPMYWGNLSVYVNSYVVVCLGSTAGVEDPWIASVFLFFWTVTLLLYGTLRKYLGTRPAALLGCLSTDLGFFASYFSVRTSFTLLNATVGALAGVGMGLVQAHCLRLLVDWADNDTGFLLSLSQGAFFWGAAIINQIVTVYANPGNLAPGTKIGNSLYFSQREILDRTPSTFLVLGCFSVACHVIGYLLMRENTFGGPVKGAGGEEEAVVVADVVDDKPPGTTYNSVERVNKRQEEVARPPRFKEAGIIENDVDNTEAAPVPSKTNQDLSDQDIDLTPKEVLKTSRFYVMWIVYFFVSYSCLMISNYYKTFGQLYIRDDHFLTYLGTAMGFGAIVMKTLLGLAIDKIGLGNCITLEIISLSLASVWYYFTAIANRWLYFVFTILFNGFSSALFTTVPITAVSLFGKTHFSPNFALLRASALILSIACPFITEAILGHFGWFYVFASISVVHVISLVLKLFCVPML